MIQLFAFRRTLVACVMAVCSIVLVASASPANARPRHRGHHAHHQTYHHHHATSTRHARRGRTAMRHTMRRTARLEHFRNSNAALVPQDGVSMQTVQRTAAASSPAMSSGSSVVAEARRYIGGNPTGRKSLWCARFMNMVLQRSGHHTTGSDMARSFASYGQRISGPQVGAIAVMSRGRGGGHVGIVSGVDARGNPIVVSGNHNRRVAESVYARSRIYAYVMPN